MTQLQKDKLSWLAKWIPYGITPLLLLTIAFNLGSYNATNKKEFERLQSEIDDKGLDTPLLKQQVVAHVLMSRTELQDYISKKNTDSILTILKNELLEKAEVKDLAKKNAVQIYQIKEGQERNKQTQKEILKKLDEIVNRQQ